MRRLHRANAIALCLLCLFAALLGALRYIHGPFGGHVEADDPRWSVINGLNGALVVLSFPLGWLGQVTPATTNAVGVVWLAILTAANCYLWGFAADVAFKALNHKGSRERSHEDPAEASPR